MKGFICYAKNSIQKIKGPYRNKANNVNSEATWIKAMKRILELDSVCHF
jgi:hypothetical protein